VTQSISAPPPPASTGSRFLDSLSGVAPPDVPLPRGPAAAPGSRCTRCIVRLPFPALSPRPLGSGDVDLAPFPLHHRDPRPRTPPYRPSAVHCPPLIPGRPSLVFFRHSVPFSWQIKQKPTHPPADHPSHLPFDSDLLCFLEPPSPAVSFFCHALTPRAVPRDACRSPPRLAELRAVTLTPCVTPSLPPTGSPSSALSLPFPRSTAHPGTDGASPPRTLYPRHVLHC